MSKQQNIMGVEKLEEKFGEVPTFHDSEILKIILDRDVLSLSLQLLMPRSEDKKDVGSYSIGLTFSGIDNVRLENFNYQNVVSSLLFDEYLGSTAYSMQGTRRTRVSLDTLFGCWLSLTCSYVAVDSVSETSARVGRPPYVKANEHSIGDTDKSA